MAFERISVGAGGQLFEGWKTVTITAAINQFVREFVIGVSEIGPLPETPWNFPPNTPVEVFATGEQVLNGYVDEYAPSSTPTGHEVTIKGRGKGQDYVDSSVVHPTGLFEQKTVAQIAQELDKFGIGITVAAQAMERASELIPFFQIRQGSTCFAEMMRLLPQRGLTFSGLADGSTEITRASDRSHTGGLIQGQNMLSMSALLTSSNLFSDTLVIGQGDEINDDDFEPEGTAATPNVPRYRPRVIVDTTVTNSARAQQRAQWESERSVSQSAKATIVVPGWRDEAGQLWRPSWLVHVTSSFLKLDQPMTIEKVTYHQSDDQGTITSIDLVLPETYAGSGTGSGPVSPWGFDFTGKGRPGLSQFMGAARTGISEFLR